MSIQIDPLFSVYQLVRSTYKATSVMNHRKTMQVISHEIEDASIIDGAETIIFASFQRMSRFIPQMKRYRKLAECAQHIYVFGIPDIEIEAIENISYIHLSERDRLSKEWFLISYGRDFFSALATEELSKIDDPDSKRIFQGIWTFDLPLVMVLRQWLGTTVEIEMPIAKMSEHDFKNQTRLMGQSMERLTKRIQAKRQEPQVLEELQHLMNVGLTPALESIRKTDMMLKV